MGTTVLFWFFLSLNKMLIIDLCLACLILLRPEFSDCVIKFAHIVMDSDITKNLIAVSLTE